jgi:hypothetical protein
VGKVDGRCPPGCHPVGTVAGLWFSTEQIKWTAANNEEQATSNPEQEKKKL